MRRAYPRGKHACLQYIDSTRLIWHTPLPSSRISLHARFNQYLGVSRYILFLRCEYRLQKPKMLQAERLAYLYLYAQNALGHRSTSRASTSTFHNA